MYQNVIVFNNYSTHYQFTGTSDGFFPLTWISKDELSISTNSPESRVLNFIAIVIADRTGENGPKVSEMLRTTLQMIFFDPHNPISVWKNKSMLSSAYKEHDEVLVYVEGKFGKLLFNLQYQNKEWQIQDIKEVINNG